MKGKVLAGAMGGCVHVAGVVRFLKLAEDSGYETKFLGAAVSTEDFLKAIEAFKPDIVGMSYRLSPEAAEKILLDFRKKAGAEVLKRHRFVFGGTPPVCRIAESIGIFEQCFTGLENISRVLEFLGCEKGICNPASKKDDLIDRIRSAGSMPLLRHHFGLPDMERTVEGIKMIAEADVLDVISIAPDQNAQESFFRPGEMDPLQDGAGGVPLRKKEDLIRIKEASKRGNYPMLRIYSGTRDLVQWAGFARETINNAWGAVPLCWYSSLDGRSKRLPADAIRENQDTMKWYGRMGIPLEVNEAHHWSLRDSHDAIAVAMAYMAAYNAKAAGVRYYVAQYMFNTPPMITPAMDLAKMLAKVELIESLHDHSFTSFRQVRAGLLHLSPTLNIAKGQLAASTVCALMLKPQIIHVVGYCEGDHAAEAADVIESCQIVQGVIRNCLTGSADTLADPAVAARKKLLIEEAVCIIEAIGSIGAGINKGDFLTDPETLAASIKTGILDAPHLKGNPNAAGKLETRCINGAMDAWDANKGRRLTERERLWGEQ
ncbi:hypothetical protein MASR2M70_08980 [Bacillota bacterium]